LLGIPIDIAGAAREHLWKRALIVTDTLQIPPSCFKFMPAAMLSRAGDCTALYAVRGGAPAICYRTLGRQRIDPRLTGAGALRVKRRLGLA